MYRVYAPRRRRCHRCRHTHDYTVGLGHTVTSSTMAHYYAHTLPQNRQSDQTSPVPVPYFPLPTQFASTSYAPFPLTLQHPPPPFHVQPSTRAPPQSINITFKQVTFDSDKPKQAQQSKQRKKRRLQALNLTPEELKAEQQRLIALRKEREEREAEERSRTQHQGDECERKQDVDEEDVVNEEEERARARYEEEEKQKAIEREKEKQKEKERRAELDAQLERQKIARVVAFMRAQGISLDKFWIELTAAVAGASGSQSDPVHVPVRTFDPQTEAWINHSFAFHGPSMLEALLSRHLSGTRPESASSTHKRLSMWINNHQNAILDAEAQKLSNRLTGPSTGTGSKKRTSDEKRKAVKAAISHLDTWGVVEDMKRFAPNMAEVVDRLRTCVEDRQTDKTDDS